MIKNDVRIAVNASICVVAASLGLMPLVATGASPDERSDAGKELFVRRFVPTEGSPGGGDGLGPLFNHSSCAACHFQGSLGGAGGVEFNVMLLTADLAKPNARPARKTLLTALRAVHPAFIGDDGQIAPSIIIHRFGPDEHYSDFKANLGVPEILLELDAAQRDELVRQLGREPLANSPTKGPLKLVRSQRNTTALFGAGLIDAIPDSVLHDLAARQAAGGEVSGRVPPIGHDKAGRFGWRGQQPHLHDFVLGACANELGLEVPQNQQPLNPLRPKHRADGLDLTAEECRQLTSFVAALPPPKFVEPLPADLKKIVAKGRTVFDTVGCAACHVPRIGPIEGIYSDLLLHDMGSALADPVLAAASLILIKEQPADDLQAAGEASTSIPQVPLPPPQPRLPSRYNGGGSSLVGNQPATIRIVDPTTRVVREFKIQATPLDREWRTPPLWGVADSGPYLHDGRAATVVEAIALHGGEADACTKRYFALPAVDRLAVLEFLKCLKAP